jgi:hypothetical protein
VNTCVRGSANYTYISNNLNAFAYNYAAGDGNSEISKNIQKYNIKMESECKSHSITSNQNYLLFIEKFNLINSSYHDHWFESDLLSSCIDSNDVKVEYLNECCDITIANDPYYYYHSNGPCSVLVGDGGVYYGTRTNLCPIDIITGIYLSIYLSI